MHIDLILTLMGTYFDPPTTRYTCPLKGPEAAHFYKLKHRHLARQMRALDTRVYKWKTFKRHVRKQYPNY